MDVEQIHAENILGVMLDYARVYAEYRAWPRRGTRWRQAELCRDGLRLSETLLLWAAGVGGVPYETVRRLEDQRKAYAFMLAELDGQVKETCDDFLPQSGIERATRETNNTTVYNFGFETWG